MTTWSKYRSHSQLTRTTLWKRQLTSAYLTIHWQSAEVLARWTNALGKTLTRGRTQDRSEATQKSSDSCTRVAVER